jgi:hypothetical protein
MSETQRFEISRDTMAHVVDLPAGYAWTRVQKFRNEDGVWQPYSGDDILPLPALKITCELWPELSARVPTRSGLTPSAQHALDLIHTACERGSDLTGREIRNIIKRIFGDRVDQEVTAYFESRNP